MSWLHQQALPGLQLMDVPGGVRCGYGPCERALDRQGLVSLHGYSWVHHECGLEAMARVMSGEWLVEMRDNMEPWAAGH